MLDWGVRVFTQENAFLSHELSNEVMEELTVEGRRERRGSFWCFVTLL
jgi:hypothetical protein